VTVFTNAHAERLLLDVRAARQAAATTIDGRGGAFVVFPTSVVTAGRQSGQLVFPLDVSLEPGSLCDSSGRVHVEGKVGDVELTGSFWWTVAGTPPPPARYVFRSAGRTVAEPPWAAQLPRSGWHVWRDPFELQRDRYRLLRHGALAEHRLLRLTEQVLQSCCRGPLGSALGAHRLVEAADVVQRGLQVALRLLPLYASADRPPRAWLGMVHLDGKRDMHRAVAELDWLPRDLGEVVQRARVEGIALDDFGGDADLALAALLECFISNHRPLPRVTADQVQVALLAPESQSFEAPLPPTRGWQPPEGGLCKPDPALDAVDLPPGQAAAAIATLVTRDRATVDGALLGEPAAMRVVAEGVLARIRRRGEDRATTRSRSRQRFLASGRLLRAPGFADVPTAHLAALDAALREALDLEPVA
jgi:hypothetical protein